MNGLTVRRVVSDLPYLVCAHSAIGFIASDVFNLIGSLNNVYLIGQRPHWFPPSKVCFNISALFL